MPQRRRLAIVILVIAAAALASAGYMVWRRPTPEGYWIARSPLARGGEAWIRMTLVAEKQHLVGNGGWQTADASFDGEN